MSGCACRRDNMLWSVLVLQPAAGCAISVCCAGVWLTAAANLWFTSLAKQCVQATR